MHTCPFLIENGNFYCLRFQNKTNDNFLRFLNRLILSQVRACSFTGIQHRDVIDFKENLRFHPSTPVHNGVFKDIHAGEGL